MPNLVPYDKFRSRNIEKAWEYLNHIARISPEGLKYGDKKSLKGKAIFDKLARRDVLTGLVPCEDIPTWISLCCDSVFTHKKEFSIFNFPKRFSTISWKKSSLY